MKNALNSILAILFLCCVITASAEVYRWVDGNGRVQFSDQPPPDVNAQKVETRPATGKGSASGGKNYQQQDQEFRKRRVEEDENAKKRTETEKQASAKQKNCDAAKSQLAALQAGGRFSRTNQKGEREVLDDKAMQAALSDAKQAVADWCQ